MSGELRNVQKKALSALDAVRAPGNTGRVGRITGRAPPTMSRRAGRGMFSVSQEGFTASAILISANLPLVLYVILRLRAEDFAWLYIAAQDIGGIIGLHWALRIGQAPLIVTQCFVVPSWLVCTLIRVCGARWRQRVGLQPGQFLLGARWPRVIKVLMYLNGQSTATGSAAS
jgi:hypothetical protein